MIKITLNFKLNKHKKNVLDTAKEHKSKEYIRILNDFYRQKYASKANSTSKTEDLYDSTMNLSSISTISSINQDTDSSINVVSSLPPPPLPHLPASDTKSPQHSSSMKACTPSSQCSGKSKQRNECQNRTCCMYSMDGFDFKPYCWRHKQQILQ